MADPEDFYRTAGAALQVLVRAIVRDEIRRHLGPEGDYLMNIRQAPMSRGKLMRLISMGEIEGFKHGRETFVRASDFRAYVERRPVPPRRIRVPEPAVDEEQERLDELRVGFGLVLTNPAEQRAFELRLAARRAAGGERAASLSRAEQKYQESLVKEKEREERAARRKLTKSRNLRP